MNPSILVEGKIAGQKRSLFTDWYIEWPPLKVDLGKHLTLRELIRAMVAKEVEAFTQRQEARRLVKVMIPQAIQQGITQGKVDPGERILIQPVNLEEAIETALQAFMDGQYFVFVDEVQITGLDEEVFIKANSKVLFLRLTALVGG